MLEFIKRFAKSSAFTERVALEIYERLPLPLRYRVFYGPAFFHWQSLLKISESWDKDRLDTIQFEQTKELLLHAIKNVPFYKKLFPSIGFQPAKIQSLDDIRLLPYISKDTVRDSPYEFIDERISLDDLIEKPTSGSTGIPIINYVSKESRGAFFAFRGNLLGRIGHSLKSREVVFWSMVAIGKNKNLPFMKYGNKLILSNRYLMDKWLHRYIRMIEEFDPEFISGFPSVLSVVSAFMKKRNAALFLKNLKAVIVYAETLYGWQRKLIEEVFGVRVFSMYAMTELVAIGGECEHSNLIHFYPQYGLAEFESLDTGHSELIATGFTNYAMPLIRYRTGDMVSGSKRYCDKCGRYHQVVDQIEGRINDFLVTKQGKIIPRLMPWIKIFSNIKQCQFFQKEPGKAYLKIVRAEKYTDADTQFIRLKLEEMLGPMKDTISIEIVFVDEIEKSSSGKTLMVNQKMDMGQYLGLSS